MKKPTLTIGIPVYNEESNIINLLTSIIKQGGTNYTLKEILVLNDGSSDGTAWVVSDFAKSHKKVHLIEDGKRVGKSERLNRLYQVAKSEFILSLDGDVYLRRTDVIDELFKKMKKNILLVGARFIPVPQKTFMGKLSVISYKSFEDAVMQLNNGNNIYSMVGGAQLIRASFAKTVVYPKKTVSDQNYLFASAALKDVKSYVFAKNAEVYTRTVSTFHDWRVLGVRSTSEDKASLRRNMGDKVMEQYYMPRKYLVKSLLKFFMKSPIYTTGSVLMNIYIRTFPYSTKPKNGKWELTLSSKIGILL